MDLKEGIKKLGELIAKFNSQEAAPEVPATEENVKETFTDVKTTDGMIISYDGDMPAQGMPLFIMTEQGRLPAPDGEYELEDGSSIVSVGGLIAEVKPTEAEAPVAPDATATPDANAPVPPAQPQANGSMDTKPKRVIKSQVEEHVFNAFKDEVAAKFAELTEKFSKESEELKAENKGLSEKLALSMEFNAKLSDVLKEISDAPSTTPTEKISKPFDMSAQRKAFKEDLKALDAKFAKENN